MKDNLMLLAAGIICALLAWAFFAYLQDYALTIFWVIIAIVVLEKPARKKFGHKNTSQQG